uniref:kirola-like n=1 Tax=Erigeron canadensis TaxID=72917 RepID=UPI001CB936FB|nr:kirola-like [Erigeron canadensis]
MGVTGKMIIQADTKCNGDVVYELLRYRPNDLSIVAPDHVQGCNLHEGQWGAIGSITTYTYLIGGKPQASKVVIEAADDNKKSITFRAIGGETMQVYKSFRSTAYVKQNDEKSLVTWTFEYEKMREGIPDPDALVDITYKITNAMDSLQLQPQ